MHPALSGAFLTLTGEGTEDVHELQWRSAADGADGADGRVLRTLVRTHTRTEAHTAPDGSILLATTQNCRTTLERLNPISGTARR
jgi:hypothetical protein